MPSTPNSSSARKTLSRTDIGEWEIRTISGTRIQLSIGPTSTTLVRHGAPGASPLDGFTGTRVSVRGFHPLRVGEDADFFIWGFGGTYLTSEIVSIEPLRVDQ
jgi:hypothetical protein